MNVFDRSKRYLKRKLKTANSRGTGELLCFSYYKGQSVIYNIQKIAFIESKLINHGIHSEDILDLVDKFIRKDSIFLDIGANIGTITQPIAARWQDSNLVIHSFEASKTIYNTLQTNISLNRLKNVTLHNGAVTDFDGSLTLYEVNSDSKNNGLSSTLNNSDIENPVKNEVRAMKIDGLMGQFKLPVSVIKVDVQGAELSVLRGAIETIKRDRPVIIFEHEDRYHQDCEKVKQQLNSLFSSLSYRIYKVDANHPDSFFSEDFSGYVESNLVAIPFVENN
jgi:FkbM family methyltransferase